MQKKKEKTRTARELFINACKKLTKESVLYFGYVCVLCNQGAPLTSDILLSYFCFFCFISSLSMAIESRHLNIYKLLIG